MALIVETGDIVENADSYATRADFIAYALKVHGVTIADAEAADVMMRQAALFIAAHEANLKGSRVDRDQPMAFPRSGLVVYRFAFEDNEIPPSLIQCQFEIALDINAGIDPYNPPASASNGVRRKRIEGAVEIEYAISDQQLRLKASRSRSLLMSLLRNINLFNVATVSRG
jgi:hypothetical protein